MSLIGPNREQLIIKLMDPININIDYLSNLFMILVPFICSIIVFMFYVYFSNGIENQVKLNLKEYEERNIPQSFTF